MLIKPKSRERQPLNRGSQEATAPNVLAIARQQACPHCKYRTRNSIATVASQFILKFKMRDGNG